MSHTIWRACAVAVTDKPGTAAVAEFGPHVVGPTSVHNHTGSPTRPCSSPSIVILIAGPVSAICASACWAN
ncbi:hypothetical protein ASD18_12410 [Cellulomonas sp. Root137]|nr:hypothetical protein ASD18_12410 [Cellulomonas sp. Root137]